MGHRAGLDSAENLAPTEFRSPDRPARSESLYRLSYSGPQNISDVVNKETSNFIRNFWD